MKERKNYSKIGKKRKGAAVREREREEVMVGSGGADGWCSGVRW